MNIETSLGSLCTFSLRHRAYLSAVFEEILSHYGGELVGCAIFGSYARRENRLNSDLDLLILLDTADSPGRRISRFVDHIEMKHEKLAQELYEQDGILCDLSPYILSRSEAAYVQLIYYDFVEHHVIVSDPFNLIARIVRSMKKHILRTEAKKYRLASGWLWETKASTVPAILELNP